MSKKDRFSRQSFLGDNVQEIIENISVAIVGLGGGGSHIVQQLAHVGVMNYVLYDNDPIEGSNLNRLVGAEENDVKHKELKVHIAQRLIKRIRANADVQIHRSRWQENPLPLRQADIIFGCVDSFSGRREIEALARRYLIPYIDIGMDVSCLSNQTPRVAGQVILSMPGYPCMRCIGFLNEQSLTKEAAAYGDAGQNPQVVWSNGVLASTAVGLAVDLLTNWSNSLRDVVYLSYDGNKSTIAPHARVPYIQKECSHYPSSQVGNPVFKQL